MEGFLVSNYFEGKDVSQYTSKIWKEELVYEFDEGVLSCTSSNQGTKNTLSLDLNSTPVTVSQKIGHPFQFKMSVYGLILGTGICAYMGVQDFLDGDTVGVIGSAFAWVVLMVVLGHLLFKNIKKHKYLTLLTKDKGGMNIVCSQPERADDFEAFIQDVQGFLEIKKAEF